jgi:hypothetical protein
MAVYMLYTLSEHGTESLVILGDDVLISTKDQTHKCNACIQEGDFWSASSKIPRKPYYFFGGDAEHYHARVINV